VNACMTEGCLHLFCVGVAVCGGCYCITKCIVCLSPFLYFEISILVMDQGQVAEFDTPRKLLQDPSSMFSRMVDETGPSNAALLRSLAGC